MIQESRVPGEYRDRVGGLLEEVERLSMIVERLFALSRLDAGEAQSEWSDSIWRSSRLDGGPDGAPGGGRRIAVTCDAASPVAVEGDRSRLKQVVVNLLDNAIKYTLEGGAVRLRVFASRTGRCSRSSTPASALRPRTFQGFSIAFFG